MTADAHAAPRVKITWPAKTTLAPGETVRVAIASERRVKVVLVRESRERKAIRVERMRRMRTGTFEVEPKLQGNYSIRVSYAGERRVRRLAVERPLPCDGRMGDRAELRLAVSSARAGEALPAEVVNTSTGCIRVGPGQALERLEADGGWSQVGGPITVPSVGLTTLAPGDVFRDGVTLPAELSPGTYRVRATAVGSNGLIVLLAEFAVVP